jgi:hypothetical protein
MKEYKQIPQNESENLKNRTKTVQTDLNLEYTNILSFLWMVL